MTNDNLAPHLDLFVRDLAASNTVLVSVSTNGFGGANDNIGLYTLSSNAQVVAFDTAANNLVAWDNNRVSDVYVRDLAFGSMTRVSMGVDGDANGPSTNPLISEDGRYIIFESLASNLVTNDFNGTNDIFIHDLATGGTELVSVNADGSASPDGPSHSPSISADGLTVAFVSHATNLVEGVTNKLGEIFVRHIAGNTNLWAQAAHLPETHSRSPASGALEPYRASEPVLSADGRYVAFKTLGQVVRFDLTLPTNSLFLTFSNSPQPDLKIDFFRFDDNPRLALSTTKTPLAYSRDGRNLALNTSSNLSPNPGIALIDFEALTTNVFVTYPSGSWSHTTNVSATIRIVLTNYDSAFAPTWREMPWLNLSEDVSRLLFLADATNLVADVTNRTFQIYGLDLENGAANLLSTNASGNARTDLSAISPGASPDGSFIAWDSPDDNIVEDDLNRAWDVFVRNVDTGETQVASAPHPDLPPQTGRAMARTAGSQSISGDGRKVVFLTRDNSLTPNDTNTFTDAILRDLHARTNAAVSGPFPARINQHTSIVRVLESTNEVVSASISADGRYAVFTGGAYDTYSRVFAGFTNAFWRDLELNTNDFAAELVRGIQPALSRDGRIVAVEILFNWVSGQRVILLRDLRSLPGLNRLASPQRGTTNASPNGPCINPSFSPDSRWVVFQSLATDLTYDGDNILGYQLYAREIDTTFIKRISYSGSDGTNAFPLSGGATNPVFSADARFVFFEGSTSNLIYRHDLLNDMDNAGTARRSNLVVCTGCANPSASSEGRLVAYESRPGPGLVTNVFVEDLASGRVELVSVSMTGTNGNGPSFTPLLSHDARFVVFASRASDLVPGDHNRATDIFVRDRFAGVTHCLSRNWSGTGTGNRVSSNPILSAGGRTVAFQSFASDLVPGDYNDTRDVFVVTLGGPDTDGDGMDDDWEMAYFNTPSRDGSGDFDNDGATDLAEFRAGTNPANDASILRVLTMTTSIAAGPDPRRTTVLLWSAIPGKTYRVEFKASFDAPWAAVSADVTAGSTSASLTDTVEATDEPNNPHRFYRVLLVH